MTVSWSNRVFHGPGDRAIELALVPLILLLCSGLYLFALPYVGTRRSRGRA